MKTVATIFGPFDAELAKKFKAAYEAHINDDHFWFEFHPSAGSGQVLTSLAKYLIEFLTNEGLLD